MESLLWLSLFSFVAKMTWSIANQESMRKRLSLFLWLFSLVYLSLLLCYFVDEILKRNMKVRSTKKSMKPYRSILLLKNFK